MFVNEDSSVVVPLASLVDVAAGETIGDAASRFRGTVTLTAAGVEIRPDPDYFGGGYFAYSVQSPTSEYATVRNFFFEVRGTPDPAVAVADVFEAEEDSEIWLAGWMLAANDIDPDQVAPTVTRVFGAVHGSVVLENGWAKFMPDPDYAGPAGFSYAARDDVFGETTASVTLNVHAVNDAPVATADTLVGAFAGPRTIQPGELLLNDSDIDGDALFVEWLTDQVGVTTAVNTDGSITITPRPGFSGTGSFVYSASDGRASSYASVSFQVLDPNRAPVTMADSYSLDEDRGLDLLPSQLLANDADPDGDTLTVTAVGSATHGEVQLLSYGVISFRPDTDFNGQASFTYTAADPSGKTSTSTVTLDVLPRNDAPRLSSDFLVAYRDTPVTVLASELLANDWNDEATARVVRLESFSANGAYGALDVERQTITFTPAPGFVGTDFFSYVVSDGEYLGWATVRVEVRASGNLAPVLGADHLEVLEDTPTFFHVSSLLANDYDREGDAFSVFALYNIDGGTGGVVNWEGSQSFSFRPFPGYVGPGAFRYYVSDARGSTSWADVSVSVGPGNDAPVSTDVTLAPAFEEATVLITSAQLVAGASDIDGDALRAVGLTADRGTVHDNGDGTWTYTLAPDDVTVVSFTYEVSDGTVSVPGSARLPVTPVNDAPVVEPVVLAPLLEDDHVFISAAELLQNATEVDLYDVLAVSQLAADSGNLVYMGGGTWIFTPSPDDDTSVSFTYLVGDGAATTPGRGTMDLVAVNDRPVAVADSFQAIEDVLVVLDVAHLLGNDRDVDDASITVSAVHGAAHGSVVLVDGQVRFAPSADYEGLASFRYTLRDAHGGEAIGQVTLQLAAVNDAPRAQADSFVILEDAATVFLAADLLGNDWNDDGAMVLVEVLDGNGGSVELSADGQSVMFTPDGNFFGEASFRYRVGDGEFTVLADVGVSVSPVNDAPVAAADLLSAAEDTSTIFAAADLLDNDDDVEDMVLEIIGVAAGAGGTVRLNDDGSVTFKGNLNFVGEANFSYTVRDSEGLTSDAQVTVDVLPVDDAPLVGPVTLAASAEDAAVLLTEAQLLAGASDIDGDTLTVLQLAASSGSLVDNGNGTWIYRPVANDDTSVRFDYEVSDGRTALATVAMLDLLAVADAPIANDDALFATEDVPVTYKSAQLLGNDTDAEGQALTIGTVSAIRGGAVRLNEDGTVTFTPNPNFFGPAAFSYTARDSSAASSAAEVQVTVFAVDDAPIARDDVFATVVNTPINLMPAVLANDEHPEGWSFHADFLDDPNVSVFSSSTDVVFTPPTGFVGTYHLPYVLRDGYHSAWADIEIRVYPGLVVVGNAGDDALLGSAGDDSLSGGTGNDTLTGLAGNDVLDGGSGADHMSGGAGDDEYIVSSHFDGLFEAAGEGVDTVHSSVDFGLPSHFEHLELTGAAVNGEGNDLANRIVGNNEANQLRGYAGADTLVGGAGNDAYWVQDADDVIVEEAASGTDIVVATVSHTLAANVEVLVLESPGTGTGNALANEFDGRGNNNTFHGLAGDDDYYVHAGDIVVEAVGQGWDTVYAFAGWTLADNVEGLVMFAGTFGIGNTLANRLTGTYLANTLDGRQGADTLAGGDGNDTYIVDHVGDVVTEEANGGTDQVRSSVNHTLAVHVEHLVLTGAAAIAGTGNTGANRIDGNDGDNILDGRAGSDTLAGGLGDDSYRVDNAGDSITGESRSAAGGIDKVFASLDWSLAGDYLEQLELTGTAAIDATGNGLDNDLTGNGNANVLDGGTGADTMRGGGGSDTYYVDDAGDQVVSESSAASGGIDKVFASVSWSLAGDYVEDLELTGTRAASATGNSLANRLTGNAAANVLDGGGGADTMKGGSGNDVYHVDNAGDVVGESGGAGTDLVVAQVSRTLGDHQENLTLAGSAAIRGFGNSLGNVLVGNSGNNVLDGGSANDSLSGAGGNDTLLGGSGSDRLAGGAGKDVLTGGSGNDRFIFSAAAESSPASADAVTDFARGADQIDLTGLDANAAGAGLQHFSFIGKAAFGGNATGQLRYAYDGARLVLYGSTDSDATAEFAVAVTGISSVAAADLLL